MGGEPPVRIAMWSGPRNISTAMMRSFENRPDCAVIDEPFYAAYLAETGIHHPMREEVLASQPRDATEVIKTLLGPVPRGAAIFYQKHMTHHMIEKFDLGWMSACHNVFLIRSPERVVASYARKRGEMDLADLGFARQVEIFERESQRLGAAPIVIDADDVLADPAGILGALCSAVGIAFSEQMLRWPQGRRPSDGVWGAHWYGAVETSTGFVPSAFEPISGHTHLIEEAMPYYHRMQAFALRAI